MEASEEDLGYLVLKQLRPLIQHFVERQAQAVAKPLRARIFELERELAEATTRAVRSEAQLAEVKRDSEAQLVEAKRELADRVVWLESQLAGYQREVVV